MNRAMGGVTSERNNFKQISGSQSNHTLNSEIRNSMDGDQSHLTDMKDKLHKIQSNKVLLEQKI